MRPWHTISCGTPEIRTKIVGDDGGHFWVQSPIDNRALAVVASNGMGWDHVSVSRHDRAPTWTELEHVKRLFFADNEVAMQLHVPADDHINIHPYCLHLWRPQDEQIPMPPKVTV